MSKWSVVRLLLLVGLFSVMMWGQEPPPGLGAVSQYRFGVGARALALGGAYTAVAAGPVGLYWNPAGLAWTELMAGGMYTQPFGDPDIRLQYLAGALPIEGWGVGAAWFNYHVANIPHTEEGTFFSYDSSVFQLGVGREVELLQTGPRLALGVTLKVYYEQMLEGRALGLGLDVGLKLVGADWSLGYCAQDVGTTRYRWQGTGQEPVVVVPWVHRAGISRWFADRQWLVSLEVVVEPERAPQFRGGLEWTPVSGFSLQGGVQLVRELGQHSYQPRFSFGASFQWEDFLVEAGYLHRPLTMDAVGEGLTTDTYVFSLWAGF